MTGSVPRRHDVLIQHDVEARMRDGVVLRANVYRPADDGRYPVLLSRQPYNKDVNINLMYADPVFLAARGYIVVMQDVRGRYASDGEFAPSDQEFEDGYDTVQWAAGLPGSDGQVGMFGRSYHAETQWRAAVMEPPALKSMIAGVSRFHHVTEAQERPGGANEGSRLGWLQFQIGADLLLRRHRTEPQELACAMAEFGATTARLASGELLDLLPLRQLADLPGSLMAPVIAAIGGPLDTPLYRRPWPDNTYERVHADTFHIGGWYDIFTPGTLSQYEAMRDVAERHGRRPPHLLVGPWTHSSYLGNTGQLDFGPSASGATLDGRGGLNGEHLRWYDATLKGDADAIAETAPVRLFVMGENRWRCFDRYPVPGARTEEWHLQPDGGLDRAAAPPSDPDGFDYDPARPRPHPRRIDHARADAAAGPLRPARHRVPAGCAVLHQHTDATALHGAWFRVGDAVRGLVRAGHRFRRPPRRRPPRRACVQRRGRHNPRLLPRHVSRARCACSPRHSPPCNRELPTGCASTSGRPGSPSCPAIASASTSPPAVTPAGSAIPTPSATPWTRPS